MIKTKLLHTSPLTLCGLRRAELDYTLAFDAECQLWRHVQQVFNEPWHVFLWQTQDQLQSWDRIWERNHISWEEGPLSSAYEKVHVSYLYLNLWRRGTKIRLVASSSTQPPVTGGLQKSSGLPHFADNFKNGVCSSSSQLVSMEA